MNHNLLAGQMDYIFFCYGASFIFLGAVCHAILRCSPDAKKLPWFWLGLFGFAHGLNEWMDMVAVSLGDHFYFRVARLIVMVVSFVFLMEFARRGTSEAAGRHLGAGFYAWLFIVAAMGAWSGWDGINASSRYCFGLVSGVWSACILLSFKGSGKAGLNRFAFILLKIGGVSLLLYGLTTGLVVPQARFFPASIISTNSFISLTHLPVQLFRAVFAFILATCTAFYAINQSLEAFLRQERAKQRRFVIYSVISVAVILLSLYPGWVVADTYGSKVAQEERSARHLKSSIFVQFTRMVINKLETIEAMANSPEIRNAILDISVQQNIDEVNERLDRYKNALDTEVCYIMDASGMTIASSNRASDKSFVGKSYAFRPYFQQALKGGRGLYLAKGVTSDERGIYVSYPIFDMGQSRIVGVAVAKATMDDMEQFFRTYDYVILASPEGVIFVSSKPEWVLRSIRDLSRQEKEDLRGTNQFGQGPWDNAGFEDKDDPAGTIMYQGRRFFFVSDDIKELPGWKVYFLDDRSNASAVRFMLIMIFMSFFLLMAIIALFIFRISLDTLHLSASEALYEALVESSPDAIKLINREGRCISVNNSSLRMMGWKKEDVIGKFFEELWPVEYRDKIQKAIYGVLEGRQQSFEASMTRADGSNVIKLVTLAPIFEVTGDIRYFIAVSRDITEERRSMERLVQSSKVATVGALATGVSHEFNNVLEIILGNAEAAYSSKDPDAIKQALKVIVDSARRAAWIIKSMLDFSGKPSEAREFVNMADLIKQNLVLLNKVFEANGIVVETRFKEVPRVSCNPGQISQAFVNIMMNARDAMRGLEEKILVIAVDYMADLSEVSIAFLDSGCGIKEDVKHMLFGPFVTTKGILGGGYDKQPGVGLGLFVAYGIVKQHNGNITVESEEGRGAKFTIFLPVFSGDRKPRKEAP
ncbi:MAG TPA: hypothetical protein DCL35_06305 [Candidatus Omnitrophica bacterium]|nr:hypothetical protein [Candidatus Omnitrophota bacterium]